MSVLLYGWPPMFGCQGPSPYPLKTEIQLQLLGVAYECRLANLEAVPKHKAPYVDDGGEIIEDSTFIRFHFETKLNKDLNAGLTPEQRAAAWGLERMLEDRLYHLIVAERWLESDNFERGPAMFFQNVPEQARAGVIKEVREGLRTALTVQGFMRHSREERMQLAARDIAAISAKLGDKPFMFGDTPTALDGAAFGMIEAANAPIFDTQLRELIERRPNLLPYLARMKERFFSKAQWPMAA